MILKKKKVHLEFYWGIGGLQTGDKLQSSKKQRRPGYMDIDTQVSRDRPIGMPTPVAPPAAARGTAFRITLATLEITICTTCIQQHEEMNMNK